MSILSPIEYEQASAEVRAVYDDIRAVRKTTAINNFWKTLAHDPALLRSRWETVRATMAPGRLDALSKELVYIAVGICHGNEYAVRTHVAAARAKGMSDGMYAELVSVVQLAAGNVALIEGFGIEVEPQLRAPSATTAQEKSA